MPLSTSSTSRVVQHMLELATIRRYLKALDQLSKHPDPDIRVQARDLLATLIEFDVEEALLPIHQSAPAELTSFERLLRALAGAK